jgi:hypothetical protein
MARSLVLPNGLVRISARFSSVLTFAILSIPDATASLTQWYAMELCFFFRVEVGIVELVTTDLLSQKKLAGPSMGIPSIHNIYRKASIISTQIHRAMNSDPKVDDSTVFCALENQEIGELLR